MVVVGWLMEGVTLSEPGRRRQQELDVGAESGRIEGLGEKAVGALRRRARLAAGEQHRDPPRPGIGPERLTKRNAVEAWHKHVADNKGHVFGAGKTQGFHTVSSFEDVRETEGAEAAAHIEPHVVVIVGDEDLHGAGIR